MGWAQKTSQDGWLGPHACQPMGTIKDTWMGWAHTTVVTSVRRTSRTHGPSYMCAGDAAALHQEPKAGFF